MAVDETGSSGFPKWATESVKIENFNPTWIRQGLYEVQQLLSLLSPFGVYEVEHIGSTAIPTLPSKPILDLMAIIPSLNILSFSLVFSLIRSLLHLTQQTKVVKVLLCEYSGQWLCN